jgi:glucokinase
MTTDHIMAIDLGGTQLRVALCEPDGTVRERVEVETRAKEGRDAVLARILDTMEQLMPAEGRVQAIGVSSPGPLDPFEGVVFQPPNLPGWDRVPLRDIIQSHFEIPTSLGNDANLAALAEHRFGAGRDVRDMIYMTISTGIGGGIILDGELFVGHAGLAGEIGHMTMDPDGPYCSCGSRGCLEALASGSAISHQARILARGGDASQMMELVDGDVERITSHTVGQAAAQGDPVGLRLVNQAARYIAIAIANLMHLFNPQRLVLGGGVTKMGDLLFEPIRREIPYWTMASRFHENVPIVRAELGGDVGLLGAVALAVAEGARR